MAWLCHRISRKWIRLTLSWDYYFSILYWIVTKDDWNGLDWYEELSSAQFDYQLTYIRPIGSLLQSNPILFGNLICDTPNREGHFNNFQWDVSSAALRSTTLGRQVWQSNFSFRGGNCELWLGSAPNFLLSDSLPILYSTITTAGQEPCRAHGGCVVPCQQGKSLSLVQGT